MPKTHNVNEEIFDQRFREKPVVDYRTVSTPPGPRDAQVIRLLDGFGIQGRRCLDIGPGTGRWLQHLKDRGAASLAAVDISQEVLDRVAPLGAECRKVDLEVEPLGFETDAFDVTLAFMVLEHLRNPAIFIREVLRVTQPSGLILMTIPNIASLQSRLRLFLGYLPVAVSQDDTHVGFYTIRELEELFGAQGAEVEVIPTAFSLHPFNRRRLQVRSNRFLTGLDDHRLFRVRPSASAR